MNLIFLLLIAYPNSYDVEYYYFSAPYCRACKEQTPIIMQMNRQGYNFKISDKFNKYNIREIPTIMVVIKENNSEIVNVKLKNRVWTRKELKIMVNTVNFLMR